MQAHGRWLVVGLCAFVLLLLAPFAGAATEVASSATGVSPDAIKLFFDANAILIMFVWGLAQKYLPALAALPNTAIPWVNLFGYILVRLGGGLVGDAHAASSFVQVVPDAVGVILGGFTSAVWARQLYEGFGRGFLERLLGMKKAVPRATSY